jgi:hypothetical protein
VLRSVAVGSLVALGACGFNINPGSSIDASVTSDADTGPDADADIDAPMIDAMPDAGGPAWSTPMQLGFSNVSNPTLTGDLLQIWFEQNADIYHASRGSIFSPFGNATKVDALSMMGVIESTPEVAANGQSITFARLVGNNDLHISTWDAGNGTWMTPIPLNDLNTGDHEQAASISDDRRMLAMTRQPLSGSADIMFSTRASPSDPWSLPALQTELNSITHDGSVFLSGNKLTVCFDSQRASLQSDIFCATRTSSTVPFNPPEPMIGINSSQSDKDPWLSPSGTVMIFWSDRDGTGRLYYSFFN